MSADSPRYSFVVPLFNEQETVGELCSRLATVMDRLDGPAEAIIVDDGSRDRTFELLAGVRRRDERFKVLQLSRNFGHQTAITAGLDHASGEAVIIMDGDLQDPPEVALDLVEGWRTGAHIVYAVRQDRTVEPFLRRTAISLFYRVLRRLSDLDIPVDAGDFRLVDRIALEGFLRLRETNRYVRGMFAWVGYEQLGVPYRRDVRFAGKTKYPARRLVKLALDGVVGFSHAPLRLVLVFGFFVAGISFLYAVVAGILRLSGAVDFSSVPGWTTIVFAVCLIGGIQLMVVGALGIYLGRIYEEVKRRPLYLVREVQGLMPRDLEQHGR